MRFARLAFCWILMVGVPAVAQAAKIGDARSLDILKRMQGSWNMPCQSSVQGPRGASRVLLAVSFTHFAFETREYYDSECLRQRSSRKAQYRFILGEPQLTPEGTSAFAINFQQQSFEPDAFQLLPLNLIRVHQGRLFLARSANHDTQRPPEALDYARPFVR